MDKEKALSGVRLFSALDPRHVRSLAALCTEKHFEPGEKLMRQGENGVGLFILLSGKVAVTRRDDNGKITLSIHIGSGEILGEMAVIDGAPRSADVVAEESTSCLILTAWEFNAFLKTNPKVAVDILPVVVKRYREAIAALVQK